MANARSTRAECKLVTCPECGAFRGSGCRTINGERLAGGKYHMGRAIKVGPAKVGRKAKAA